MSLIQDYKLLFPSGVQSHLYRQIPPNQSPKGEKVNVTTYMVHYAPTDQDWMDMINGKFQIGLSPFQEDGETVRFGVIDIDRYDRYTLEDIEALLGLYDLPLVPVRTKSGGWQLFMLCSEKVRGKDMGKALRKMATWMGLVGKDIEFLPKQNKIMLENHDRGTMITLPLPDSALIQRMKNSCLTLDEWNNRISEDVFEDGPPCIYPSVQQNLRSGTWTNRNNILYQVAVFFRYKFPSDWEKRLATFNEEIVSPSLESKELNGIINQQKKTSPFYMCRTEPFESNCMKSICTSRKLGIKAKSEVLSRVSEDDMVVLDTDPPVWFVTVTDSKGEDHRMRLSTDDLFNVNRFAKRCLETIKEVPELPRPKEWLEQLNAMTRDAVTQSVPPEMSDNAALLEAIHRFLCATPIAKDMEGVMKGMSYVDFSEATVAYFRQVDLFNYMTRMRYRNITMSELYSKLVEGANKSVLPIEQKFIVELGFNVWALPITDLNVLVTLESMEAKCS